MAGRAPRKACRTPGTVETPDNHSASSLVPDSTWARIEQSGARLGEGEAVGVNDRDEIGCVWHRRLRWPTGLWQATERLRPISSWMDALLIRD